MTDHSAIEKVREKLDLLCRVSDHVIAEISGAPIEAQSFVDFIYQQKTRIKEAIALLPSTPAPAEGDAELQNKICGILSKYGVKELYEAETEILFAVRQTAQQNAAPVSSSELSEAIDYFKILRSYVSDIAYEHIKKMIDAAQALDEEVRDLRRQNAAPEYEPMSKELIDALRFYSRGENDFGEYNGNLDELAPHLPALVEAARRSRQQNAAQVTVDVDAYMKAMRLTNRDNAMAHIRAMKAAIIPAKDGT